MPKPKSRKKTLNLSQKTDKSEEHIYTDIGGMLKCTQCAYKAGQPYLMRNHYEKHMKGIIRKLKCMVCELSFKKTHHLRNHMRVHTGSKPHQCSDCGGIYRTIGELQRHVRYMHTHEKPHKCTECSYAAVEKSKLVRHMRLHTGERPRQCPHCTYSCIDNFSLNRHLRVHTREKPFKCEICNTEFTQRNTLTSHLLIKHAKKSFGKYLCNVCHALFPRRSSLICHERTLHANSGLKKCPECDTYFTDRYSLKFHLKAHKDGRNFECTICPHVTWSKKRIVSHIQQHNRRLSKHDINNSFIITQNSQKQNKDYRKPKYECNECGKRYSRKSNLVRHLQTICETPIPRSTQEIYYAPDQLTLITQQLNDGEVVVLPVRDSDDYALIEIFSNENISDVGSPKLPDELEVPEEDTREEFNMETEINKMIGLEIDTETEMSSEELPFYGF